MDDFKRKILLLPFKVNFKFIWFYFLKEAETKGGNITFSDLFNFCFASTLRLKKKKRKSKWNEPQSGKSWKWWDLEGVGLGSG